MTKRIVYINWGISSFFGWGVYGLNLALHWAVDPDIEPVGSVAMSRERLVVDPLRQPFIDRFMARSQAFQGRLKPFQNGAVTVEGTVLRSCNESFQAGPAEHDVTLSGKPTIAATFFETAQLSEDSLRRAADFPVVVTGSTWNTEVLQAYGLRNVRKVIQGIDPTLFHPAPRQGLFADRFLVFSGGKLERRKGQDIVVAAFRRFAERHPEALLVSAWGNRWPQSSLTINDGDIAAPVRLDGSGAADVAGWAAANGIGPENFLDLGFVPNAQLPSVLREMDVALFTNRAEGGTNLVAMECMACGVPTILSRNTGHLDLIEDDNGYVLSQQGELTGGEAGLATVSGWGESEVDEVVETLERVYAHRAEARDRGGRGAASVGRFTWAKTASEMKDVVLNTPP
ncbi:glycosyltransferase family 4 protein [Phenylobacterium sp.]|jgi:glycosyltransferase involved in cell wall biosynthesis|uniref:glycosyltransferase family 4 protein n=1 Tax=Phenylobacterium sp. TaxID=1871053 RepID=UPI002E36F27E|nr:glycosyltransferase family 4 protein [Phenylobacterium sp.]HEX3364875.1 glycosyltransferase family 4 protein [Phenylobacterium sp.]